MVDPRSNDSPRTPGPINDPNGAPRRTKGSFPPTCNPLSCPEPMRPVEQWILTEWMDVNAAGITLVKNYKLIKLSKRLYKLRYPSITPGLVLKVPKTGSSTFSWISYRHGDATLRRRHG